MGLVSTWLSGIGLGHAIPSFKAAGIVTPAALRELELEHYEALGVTEPEDRRKLFYLIQRIKMATDESEGDSAQETIDLVVSKTLNKTNIAPASGTSRRSSSRENNATAANTNDNGDDEVDEGEESSIILADDEASNVEDVAQPRSNISGTRRTSRRLQEQRFAAHDSSSSFGSSLDTSTVPTSNKTRKASSALHHRKSAPSSSAPVATQLHRKQSLTGYSGDAETSTHHKSRRSTRRVTTSDLDADDEASVTRRNRSNSSGGLPPVKASGLPAPRARRTSSATATFALTATRTGKQLSTIPSESVAPMSPLVDLKLDHSPNDLKPVTKERRPMGRSLSYGDVSSDNESSTQQRRISITTSGSDTDVPSNRTRNRLSLGGGGATSGSDTDVPCNKTRKSRSSVGTVTHKRANSAGRNSIGSLSRKVLIHGAQTDNSWSSQIARLWQKTTDTYEAELSQIQDQDEDQDMRIRVIVRKRPMSSQEKTADTDVIHPLQYGGSYGKILVYQPKTSVDLTRSVEVVPFCFDNVFDEAASNADIYEQAVRHLIPSVFDEGKWASVFAYGQTGSGKTYTMMGYNATGSLEQNDSSVDMKNYGLYYMAARDVFELAQEVEFQHMSISISLFEIYGGKLFDLLNERNQVKCLEDHKGKVNFPGLSEHAVSNADEVMQVIEDGACNRSTGTTSKNSDSSRSHAVLQVHVRKPGRRSNSVEHGRLTFIDLAGSERGADTATASRATRLEGAEINTSLLSLKEVIRALATGDSMAHIPFRGSKLTQVLKESFVGKNCSSVMVACIAPSMSNCEHTLNTLRYADRVKERNSTTGALSSSMATRPRDVNKSSLESGWNAPQRSTESMPVDDLLGRELDDALDEALDDALEDDPDLLDEGEDEKEPPFSSQRRRKPLQELVRTHRTIMSEMLVMCKDEMNLANNADVDRESMHSYLDELSKMHEKQCTMLTSLHEKLLEYRGHCGYSLSDDSYEDLRVD